MVSGCLEPYISRSYPEETVFFDENSPEERSSRSWLRHIGLTQFDSTRLQV